MDVFWFQNVLMDGAALLATDFFLKRGCQKRRIWLAAVILAGIETLFLLFCKNNGIYIFLSHVCFVPLTVFGTFGKGSFRYFLENEGISYGMLLLLGGIREWILEQAFLSRGGVVEYGVVIGVFVLALNGLAKRRERESYTYEVSVRQGEKMLHLSAHLDSGNCLKDIYTGKPVHIMKKKQVGELFRGEEMPVRLVPYRVLGKTDGLIRVVTIDEMVIRQGEKQEKMSHVVVGIAEKGELDGCPFDMILHAAAAWEK